MIYFQSGLYVTIQQLESPLAPAPKPLLHGFTTDFAYLVLGAFSLSESGEAFLILSNNEDQIWFISNRHLRTDRLLPTSTALRLPLKGDRKHTPMNGSRSGTRSSRPQSASRNGAHNHKGR